MKHTGTWERVLAGVAATAIVGIAALSPVAAQADGWYHNDGYRQQSNLQQNKNTMRSIAIGSAALGLLGLADHNNNLAIVGAAGAVIAGSQYEQDRHRQSVDQSWRDQQSWQDQGWDRDAHRGGY